tara:strand:+ start:407 stop:1048 length:642 start_codon:yes stop_codon:yes gene_type:complete
MYKLFIVPPSTEANSIIRLSDNTGIPVDTSNRDYQQFVDDIYTNGTGIVEGADYVGVTTYTDARAVEYPPIEDQLDKIYHSGVDAWKADIKVIKDKYPKTQVGITSIAAIPSWVNTALFEKQKEKYVEAVARLAQYELSAGVKGVVGTEKVWNPTDGTGFYVDNDVIGYLIEPLPIEVNGERNPLVVADEAERAAAQTVVNNTPQAVIDSINT